MAAPNPHLEELSVANVRAKVAIQLLGQLILELTQRGLLPEGWLEEQASHIEERPYGEADVLSEIVAKLHEGFAG